MAVSVFRRCCYAAFTCGDRSPSVFPVGTEVVVVVVLIINGCILKYVCF